jgi:hypothetical protein
LAIDTTQAGAARMSDQDRLDPARLDNLWDFGDPAGSESKMLDLLATLPPDGIAAAELRTQVARALGLQGRFTEADALLIPACVPG